MKSSRVVAAIVALLLIGAAGGGVMWALRQVPDFYEQALVLTPDPETRAQQAAQFESRTMQLVDDIEHATEWSEQFTQDQINSWLSETLPTEFPDLLPPSVSEPRVWFSDTEVMIGFRAVQERWSGVVSCRLRPWVSGPNTIAFEIQAIQAGLIPLPPEKLARDLPARYRSDGWRIQWAQSNGRDVLVLTIDAERINNQMIEAVQVADGTVTISGHRVEHTVSIPGNDSARLAHQTRVR